METDLAFLNLFLIAFAKISAWELVFLCTLLSESFLFSIYRQQISVSKSQVRYSTRERKIGTNMTESLKCDSSYLSIFLRVPFLLRIASNVREDVRDRGALTGTGRGCTVCTSSWIFAFEFLFTIGVDTSLKEGAGPGGGGGGGRAAALECASCTGLGEVDRLPPKNCPI